MVRLDGEVHIGRSCADVFDAVADERNRYDPRIRHAELLTAGPLGVGSRFRSVAASMGRPVEMVVEITGYERPRRLATTTRTASVDIHSVMVFDPVVGGTRMRWRSELQPRGLLKVLTPVLGALGRRQTQRIWTGLKHRLEADGTHAIATPADRGDTGRPAADARHQR